MDTKQQTKAPAPTAAPKLVKARVKPGNRYGAAAAGEIVEVEPIELETCAHALESLDAVKAKEAQVEKAKEDDAERLRLLDERRTALMAQRDAAILGQRMAKERAAQRVLDRTKAAE